MIVFGRSPRRHFSNSDQRYVPLPSVSNDVKGADNRE